MSCEYCETGVYICLECGNQLCPACEWFDGICKTCSLNIIFGEYDE